MDVDVNIHIHRTKIVVLCTVISFLFVGLCWLMLPIVFKWITNFLNLMQQQSQIELEMDHFIVDISQDNVSYHTEVELLSADVFNENMASRSDV